MVDANNSSNSVGQADVSRPADKGDASSHENINASIKGTDVIYRIECSHPGGLKKYKSNQPFDLDEDLGSYGIKDQEKPIIEIVTPVTAFESDFGAAKFDNDSRTGERKLKVEECDAADLKNTPIQHVDSSKLIIHSLHLVEAIQPILNYYPGQTLQKGNSITFEEPYLPLLHYVNEIRQLCNEKALAFNEQQSYGAQDEGTETHYALKVLLNVLQPYIETHWDLAQVMLADDPPKIDFESLWILFKPGVEVYFKDNQLGDHAEKPVAGIVIKVELKTDKGRKKMGKPVKLLQRLNRGRGRSRSSSPLRHSSDTKAVVHVFNLQDLPNSNKQGITRVEYHPEINFFDGKRDVTSLNICPCSIWDERMGFERRQSLVRQGKDKVEILKKGHALMEYTGSVLNSRPTYYERTLFLADPTSARLYYSLDPDTDFKNFWANRDDVGGIPCDGQDPAAPEYGTIWLHETSNLTDRQYLLLTPWVYGLTLKDKQWRIVHVEGLQEHAKNGEAINRLVLDNSNKKLIQAACEVDDIPWRVDEVDNKGEGQIIMLHGAPGTGKTYTVESYAEAYGRPLIYLTVADIGLREDQIESNLRKWLNLAEIWHAFLLIDEADVFMERRSFTDMTRNSLVAVFLRRIEYFRGLLFLTTNRPGHIDDAFLSRISISIEYKVLADDSRVKIWNGLFDKLEKDMNKRQKKQGGPRLIQVDYSAQAYVKKDEDVKALKWNGREIRNALLTAISLARYNAVRSNINIHQEGFTVWKEDFRAVAGMSGDFKKFMESFENMDEHQRASQRKDRPLEEA